MIDIIRTNTAIAGMVLVTGLYIQVWRLYRTKSAKDLSATLIIALMYNEAAWLVYGLSINEWPIISMTLAVLPGDIAILIGYLLYGRRH